MKCNVCSNELVLNITNDNYYICDTCKTQIIINKESYGKKFYANIYFQDIPKQKSNLQINKIHYKQLFNKFLNNTKFRKVFENIKNNIDDCCCYGGGFPQLELNFPVSNIIVYDLISKIYESHFDIFKEVNDVEIKNRNIEFHDYNLKNGIIKTNKKELITFIHTLEHFPFKDIMKIFKNLHNTIESGSIVFIYQPNPLMAKNKNWIHYNDQHITFFTVPTFINIIESFPDFKVDFNGTYSDDLYLVFSKK